MPVNSLYLTKRPDSVYYVLPFSQVQQALQNGNDFKIQILPEEVVRLNASRVSTAARPLIAVILGLDGGDYAIDENYVKALTQAGADLTFIHYDDVDEQLENLSPDGILLPGGCFDSPAEFYAKPELLSPDHVVSARSLAYIYAIDYANEKQLPMLGICAGFQMLAGLAGATMYVNVKNETGTQLSHKEDKLLCPHQVRLVEGSKLRRLSQNAEILNVNSVHTEGVMPWDSAAENGYMVSAYAVEKGNDNRNLVIEAIEKIGLHFVIGVQWHPEYLYTTQAEAFALFSAFVASAACNHEEKNED